MFYLSTQFVKHVTISLTNEEDLILLYMNRAFKWAKFVALEN